MWLFDGKPVDTFLRSCSLTNQKTNKQGSMSDDIDYVTKDKTMARYSDHHGLCIAYTIQKGIPVHAGNCQKQPWRPISCSDPCSQIPNISSQGEFKDGLVRKQFCRQLHLPKLNPNSAWQRTHWTRTNHFPEDPCLHHSTSCMERKGSSSSKGQRVGERTRPLNGKGKVKVGKLGNKEEACGRGGRKVGTRPRKHINCSRWREDTAEFHLASADCTTYRP